MTRVCEGENVIRRNGKHSNYQAMIVWCTSETPVYTLMDQARTSESRIEKSSLPRAQGAISVVAVNCVDTI